MWEYRETLFLAVNTQRSRELLREEQDSYGKGRRLYRKRSGNFGDNDTGEDGQKYKMGGLKWEKRGNKEAVQRQTLHCLKMTSKVPTEKFSHQSSSLFHVFQSKTPYWYHSVRHLKQRSQCLLNNFAVHSARLSLENKVAKSFSLQVYLHRAAEV